MVLVRDAEDAVRAAKDLLLPEDVLLTLGAGDVYRWGDQIMSARARDLAEAGRERVREKPGWAGQTGPRSEGTAIE